MLHLCEGNLNTARGFAGTPSCAAQIWHSTVCSSQQEQPWTRHNCKVSDMQGRPNAWPPHLGRALQCVLGSTAGSIMWVQGSKSTSNGSLSEAPAVSFCTYCWISCTCIDSQHTYFTGWHDHRGTRIQDAFAYHIVCADMSKASYSVPGTCGVSPSKGSSSSVKECPARIRRALSLLLASFSSSICHIAHNLLIQSCRDWDSFAGPLNLTSASILAPCAMDLAQHQQACIRSCLPFSGLCLPLGQAAVICRGERTSGLPARPQRGPSRASPRSSGECLLHPSAAVPMAASMQMLHQRASLNYLLLGKLCTV